MFLEQQDVTDMALVRRFLLALDVALGDNNIEYEAKRSSGRLGPLRLYVLPQGAWQRWDLDRLRRTGGAPEQYKHPCLVGDLGFRESMPVLNPAAAA
jgi:hypothetical protein